MPAWPAAGQGVIRLQDVATGKFLNLDGNNNGVLDGTGCYMTAERPGDIYNPRKLNAVALKVTSGSKAGTYLRHAGFVLHGNAYVPANYDFAWVNATNSATSAQLYNYYGGGTYLDYNGTNVLISNNSARRWAEHS